MPFENKNYDIVIIGGGASGLAAAIAAAERNPDAAVCIIERNSLPARKLRASGNGRCNYLNSGAVSASYFSSSSEPAASKLLNAVFSAYPVSELVAFFKGLGIIPASEEGGRLYPRSFSAGDVAEALIRGAEKMGVKILTEHSVFSCSKAVNGFSVGLEGGDEIACERLIIATGGKAGMQYGSKGDGYRFAEGFGHSVIKPIPALVQLLSAEDISVASGARVRAKVSLYELREEEAGSGSLSAGAGLLAEDSGELQFTKDGLSGICTFNVSRFLRKRPGYAYIAAVDLFEEYAEAELATLFEKRREEFGSLEAVLFGLIPKRVTKYILCNFKGSPTALASLCKQLCFGIKGTKSWNDAQITSGGIDLSEIVPETLASRFVPGLSFAGEVLDVDSICGGYNLSFAFASGLLAGAKI